MGVKRFVHFVFAGLLRHTASTKQLNDQGKT